MATITQATTFSKEVRGGITRYQFRYVLDDGSIHERPAWVSSVTDEAAERTARGVALLEELARAEIEEVISG